ncbi:GDP-fucose transporter 1-like isoform X1 [Varroa jacobsoni]|uniref:Sugar phosphate transporter domain-containing protein n=2 Tax=Varroa destructor TaxID=109461 RepID=A0A7M7J764_VARDE|nr:GDP-fucose transporter 1-like isoform X1 [Varroa destructor]XP_022698411.1 GDP-fucose transporter 1-like isoform X1 [Varroa jacobsoni]
MPPSTITAEYDGSLAWQYAKVVGVIAAYWVVSISMVFLNSHLLSSKDRLEAPLFITFTQCVITVGICLLFSCLSKAFPRFFWFPACTLDTVKLVRLSPVSVFFVMMITFNNLCLKYVGVAFYTVSRSLTTVFNVIFTYIILKQRTSLYALVCCGVIIGGFLLGVDQEESSGTLSLIGIIYGLIASASLSLYSIYTKKVLKLVNDSVSLLSYYNNVNAMVMFIPLIVLSGEVPAIMKFSQLDSLVWWSLVVVVGIFGFAIGYVTMLQIQVTSPLTHNVSGTAKASVQTVLAVAFSKQVKSILWWTSNALVLLGSAMYTRVRQLEMAKSYNERGP